MQGEQKLAMDFYKRADVKGVMQKAQAARSAGWLCEEQEWNRRLAGMWMAHKRLYEGDSDE